MVHSSFFLAASPPSSFVSWVLGVGVVWKGLFKKGPEGPLVLPNSCPAVPLVNCPQSPASPPTTSDQPSHSPKPWHHSNSASSYCTAVMKRALFFSGWCKGQFWIWARVPTWSCKNTLWACFKKNAQILLNMMQSVMKVNPQIKKLHLASQRLTVISCHPLFSPCVHRVVPRASPSRSILPILSLLRQQRQMKASPNKHERQCLGSQVDLQAFLLSCVFLIPPLPPIHL